MITCVRFFVSGTGELPTHRNLHPPQGVVLLLGASHEGGANLGRLVPLGVLEIAVEAEGASLCVCVFVFCSSGLCCPGGSKLGLGLEFSDSILHLMT